MMESVVTGGTATNLADPRRPARGQDGHRRDRRRRQVRHVVHRVRAGERRRRSRSPSRSRTRPASAPRRPARSRRRSWRRSWPQKVEYLGLTRLMATTDQLLNTLFDGRYRIMRKLGAGGMANVYLAEDQELGRRVAIKILNDRHAGDEQFVERFRREAKNAGEPVAPEHRLDLRPRRGRGDVLHRDGVPRRALAEGADPLARPGAGVGRRRLRAPDPRRAALRAPQRDRPPRHQAAQRARRLRGPREGDGLRHRARRREPDDRGGLDHRHRAVPLARAGARHAGRPDVRPLLARRSSSTSC